MKKQIRRLRLREGDIIVVRDPDDLRRLATLSVKGVPNCPIVFCSGSVNRFSKEYLKHLIEKM